MSTTQSTILIVDDNERNLLTLRSLLEEELTDIKVIEAKSGIVALSILMKTKVDLIILDIQMAHMDGFETAKFILSRQKTKDIPVVFLTAAYKSEDFKKKGFDLGACDYLTKPIDAEKLLGKIKGYLQLIKQGKVPKPNTPEKTVRSIPLPNKRITPFPTRVVAPLYTPSQTIPQSESHGWKNKQTLSELEDLIDVIICYSEILEKDALKIKDESFGKSIKKVSKAGHDLQKLVKNVLEPQLKGEN